MRIQRAAERTAAPWKNGSGVTWEAAVAPPQASVNEFDWRISIAQVAAGGPFSVFPDVDRVLTVIAGGGLRLHIEGLEAVDLDTASPPLAFPGDAACMADLIDGPIYDLNVMCRRGVYRQCVRRASGPFAIQCTAETTALLALDPTSLAGQPVERHDIVFASRGERLELAAGRFVVVEIDRA